MTVEPNAATEDLFAPARERALEEMLAHVPFDGWSRRAVAATAHALGVEVAEVDRLFPDGITQMIAQHSRAADQAMVAEMERREVAAMKVRDRIRTAIRVRLEANTKHREAIRRALAVLGSPFAGTLGMRLLYRTVDAMWYAAGDTATDFNFYTKRALLAGVYSSTLLYWLNDRSEGFADTWNFLDRRIDDVMRIEGLKSRLQRFGERLASGGSGIAGPRH
jgi:ubiquinone biosynthesis protein COQ9